MTPAPHFSRRGCPSPSPPHCSMGCQECKPESIPVATKLLGVAALSKEDSEEVVAGRDGCEKAVIELLGDDDIRTASPPFPSDAGYEDACSSDMASSLDPDSVDVVEADESDRTTAIVLAVPGLSKRPPLFCDALHSGAPEATDEMPDVEYVEL